jgi:hypothetical protein
MDSASKKDTDVGRRVDQAVAIPAAVVVAPGERPTRRLWRRQPDASVDSWYGGWPRRSHALQARGHRFDPRRLRREKRLVIGVFWSSATPCTGGCRRGTKQGLSSVPVAGARTGSLSVVARLALSLRVRLTLAGSTIRNDEPSGFWGVELARRAASARPCVDYRCGEARKSRQRSRKAVARSGALAKWTWT